MKGRIGASSKLRSIFPPALRAIRPTTLSKQAEERLKWIDYYRKRQNASLTCRHFGISRSLFHKWKRRFDERGLYGLKDLSRRPKTVRLPETPKDHLILVMRLRRENPEYSKYKLAQILSRDHDVIISASTIGRIIKRYNLFFERKVKQKGHPNRYERVRLPKNFKANKPGDLVEADLKHLPFFGNKLYAFVAIDRVLKKGTVHISTSPSSKEAAIAWKKFRQVLGASAALTDHGSENLGAFHELLKETNTPHYFARPRTPKDKPVVERFIGTIEREFIQWGGIANSVQEQQALIDEWLNKYHSFRPHQALGYLTPNEYHEKLLSKG